MPLGSELSEFRGLDCRMNKKYDVIIVGGGPAGIFAALELCQTGDLNILLVEKGKDIRGRECPVWDKTGSGCGFTPYPALRG